VNLDNYRVQHVRSVAKEEVAAIGLARDAAHAQS
jgi:hypothetical protein